MSPDGHQVEPVAHATRTQILETAALLFRDRGFGSVSIRDIGAAADVSSSTLYHHFTDKREILFAITDRFMVDFNAAMLAVAASNGRPTDRLRQVVTAHIKFQYIRRNDLLTSNHFRRALNDTQRTRVLTLMREYRDVVRAIIEDGVGTGEFVVSDTGVAVGVILDMVNGVREWYSEQGPYSIDAIAQVYAEAAVRVCGVAPTDAGPTPRKKRAAARR